MDMEGEILSDSARNTTMQQTLLEDISYDKKDCLMS